MDREREKLIGVRLRAFREALQIPRSKFSVSCGYGSERIASYESGRAPLPYEVFRAVTQRYNLSPRWLATTRGSPRMLKPFDDSTILAIIERRALFSEVYDAHIASRLEAEAHRGEMLSDKHEASLKRFLEMLTNEDIPIRVRRKFGRKAEPLLRKLLNRIKKDLKFRKAVSKKYVRALESNASSWPQKKELTDTETSGISLASVKPKLPALLERLRQATRQTGKMSELANWLGVPLASVSRWLSGKREPGGEIALKLLHWVEQQERQK